VRRQASGSLVAAAGERHGAAASDRRGAVLKMKNGRARGKRGKGKSGLQIPLYSSVNR
jgi:hypothetical protein